MNQELHLFYLVIHKKEVKMQESASLLKAANCYSEWKVKMTMKTRLPVWFFMFAVLVLKGYTQVLLQNKCARHAELALKTPLCLLIAQFFGAIYNRLIPAGCNRCASFNSPHLMLPRFIACIRWERCKMSMGLASALNHHSEWSYHIYTLSPAFATFVFGHIWNMSWPCFHMKQNVTMCLSWWYILWH